MVSRSAFSPKASISRGRCASRRTGTSLSRRRHRERARLEAERRWKLRGKNRHICARPFHAVRHRFLPGGTRPKWVYVAEENRVIRFPYSNGDLAPRYAPEIVVAKLASTTGGHVTRDVAFSIDGGRMFVSVGSESNDAEGMPKKSPQDIQKWEARHGLGAAWDSKRAGPMS